MTRRLPQDVLLIILGHATKGEDWRALAHFSIIPHLVDSKHKGKERRSVCATRWAMTLLHMPAMQALYRKPIIEDCDSLISFSNTVLGKKESAAHIPWVSLIESFSLAPAVILGLSIAGPTAARLCQTLDLLAPALSELGVPACLYPGGYNHTMAYNEFEKAIEGVLRRMKAWKAVTWPLAPNDHVANETFLSDSSNVLKSVAFYIGAQVNSIQTDSLMHVRSLSIAYPCNDANILQLVGGCPQAAEIRIFVPGVLRASTLNTILQRANLRSLSFGADLQPRRSLDFEKATLLKHLHLYTSALDKTGLKSLANHVTLEELVLVSRDTDDDNDSLVEKADDLGFLSQIPRVYLHRVHEIEGGPPAPPTSRFLLNSESVEKLQWF